jgi:hypothetical protein
VSERDPLRDVVVAIATYRSDDAVLRLLEPIFDRDGAHPFGHVVVVDSLGSGRIDEEARRRGWKRFTYEVADRNLGSAGNLARRLELAATRDARWVYAINHDGALDAAMIARLARHAETLGEKVGAVYPLRHRSAIDRWDLTGLVPVPVPAIRSPWRPRGASFDVFWASSNGALYALDPVRAGLLPWADLWMGYEDLGYGWDLSRHGFRQQVLCDVVFEDGYEYRTRGGVELTDKPAWYAYYGARNLLLITRRARRGPATWAAALGRIALEVAVTSTLRPEKKKRLGLLARGVADGLRGRSGQRVD